MTEQKRARVSPDSRRATGALELPTYLPIPEAHIFTTGLIVYRPGFP